MDISHDKQNLERYKKNNLLFTPLENSTFSLKGYLSGLNFNQEEIIDCLECTGNITNIDCNFGHKVSELHPTVAKKKKTNRGRKKKEKIRKNRKYQGDGSSFNTQITFTTLGTHVRKEQIINEKKADVIIEKLGGELELVTKKYKIKIFQNGSTTIPGILTEDKSDIQQPLNEVCAYLSEVFMTKVEPVTLYTVMENYKFRLIDYKVHMINLQKYCDKHFHALLNTRFSDISNYICNPVFENSNIVPLYEGWNETFTGGLDQFDISLSEMRRYLSDSINSKNLFIDFESLKSQINNIPLDVYYQKLYQFSKILFTNYKMISNQAYCNIFKYMIMDHLSTLEATLESSNENIMSYIKYNSEKYPGFLIKIKTPNCNDPDKTTTIKIFPKGKINIDGANSRSEAEFIYYWLNNLFVENPILLYTDDGSYADYDSEFSSDDEED